MAKGDCLLQDNLGNCIQVDPGEDPNAPGYAASSGGDAQSWINTLGGLFGTIYTSVNPPSTPRVVGRGIPGSPVGYRPVATQTGATTLIVLAVVAILVWFGVRKRR